MHCKTLIWIQNLAILIVLTASHIKLTTRNKILTLRALKSCVFWCKMIYHKPLCSENSIKNLLNPGSAKLANIFQQSNISSNLSWDFCLTYLALFTAAFTIYTAQRSFQILWNYIQVSKVCTSINYRIFLFHCTYAIKTWTW